MRCITYQEHVAVSHGLGHEAAQRCNTFFNRRAGNELFGNAIGQAGSQLVPETVVGPIFDFILEWYLYVVTTKHLRALATQGKAAFGMSVDKLFVYWRCF